MSELLLVTGATGAVGPAIVRAALANGYRVRTLSRHAPEAGVLPAGVDVRTGDVGDQAAVRQAVEGAACLLHLAALLHIVAPSAGTAIDYERVNADATAALVLEAARAGVRRFVLFSTVAVYGDQGDRLVDEDTVPAPDSEYARSKRLAEQAVLRQMSADGHPIGVVLRLAAVYGPRVRGNYRTMVRMLARRRFVPLGPGLNRRTLVFDEDVARAALLAVSHPAAPGRIFNVTDGTTHTVRSIIGAICSALGRRPPRVNVPLAPVRILVDLAAGVAPGAGPVRRIRAMVTKYCEHVAVDGSRIQRELGFVPAVDASEGWRRTVEGLRAAGDV